MPKNVILKPRIAADVDARVARVIERLGNPEPPLTLLVVRESLKLDFSYFSGRDEGVLQETIAKLRVAGKQVIANPMLLLRAVRKFDLRALYLPDRRRILLDEDQPKLKHRWNEAHEIGHSLIPWHEGAMLGDNEFSLLPVCHDELEAEANYAAGRLIFLRDRFRVECRSLLPSFKSLEALCKRYGNTRATTFWRCIEYWGEDAPMVGLITGHPHRSKRQADFDPQNPCKHFVQSALFAEHFSTTVETEVFGEIVRYCGSQRGGTLGAAEVILVDDNGDAHSFEFETFCYHHQTLTLGIYKAPYSAILQVA
ncbi:ImmA/IrrE family metallo-endopeptidase [Sphingomonas sp. PB4P5]|uniref:ImmA/IrrE family metallo-endopeptidase n=1 Tax=Parasphingomonas puruogangriensis TaxID=3096155 RepID=UPI002FC743F1